MSYGAFQHITHVSLVSVHWTFGIRVEKTLRISRIFKANRISTNMRTGVLYM